MMLLLTASNSFCRNRQIIKQAPAFLMSRGLFADDSFFSKKVQGDAGYFLEPVV